MGELILYIFIGLLGFGATVAYYFARYYFRVSDEDQEVLKGLKRPYDVSGQKDLRLALRNTRQNIFGRLKESIVSGQKLSDEDLEFLEEVLYTSDLGPKTVERLMTSVNQSLQDAEKSNLDNVRESLRGEMLRIFEESQDDVLKMENLIQEIAHKERPQVWMVVGVNGVGKTTTIGKMAHKAAQSGYKTLIVAGDTFRAAAGDQLKVWAERAQVEIFSPDGVKDPSAVAFDGLQKARAKGFDLVVVDTAGRLHTQENLMDELKKMKRVMAKAEPQSPHEVLIVLDANSGQNALTQAKTFNESLGLTGALLTKLDGTAKGGVAVGLAYELALPIRAIGVGEGLGDLRDFKAQDFVDSIL